jgi:nitroreductase
MDTFDAIEQRRSIKHFDKNHKLSESEIEKLLSLAILSPTSYNIQNWRFVLVKDSETRKKIRSAAWDQAQVTDSSLLLVICADLKAWKKQPERYWKNAPKEIQDMFVKMIGDFYDGKEQLQRDEGMRSCGIAAQTLMLTAKAMGYDSGAMIGFDSEKVAKIINLPDDHVIGLMVVVGKQVKPASPRGGQLPLSDIVFTDRFI